MNNLGRGNWFLMFLMLAVGFGVLVSAVSWNVGIEVFHGDEENYYQYNLTNNVSNVGDNLSIAVDTSLNNITWDNGTSTFGYTSLDSISWISLDSTNFLVNINVTDDNETGLFYIPFVAQDNDTLGTLGENWFQINATNDVPVFLNLNSSYEFPQVDPGYYVVNALDEEEHYPLNFSLTFLDNCTHADWSGRVDGENCSIFNLSGTTDTSTTFDFDPVTNDVGTYWANFSVSDFNGTCPHAYCDAATYEVNKSSGVYTLMFIVSPPLALNVSNCTGGVLTENEEFNCTIVVTTPGETDDLNLSSDASFRNDSSSPSDASWFYADDSGSAVDFSYNVSVSVTPTKSDVGNWTINFTVDNGDVAPVTESIFVYVNYTESNVTLDVIGDMTLYENSSFDVDGVDEDLLIRDGSVKAESLTFASNTSWVVYDSKINPAASNYSTATFDVDWDAALLIGEDNYSVMINVTDLVGNTHNRTFTIQILNETAPTWNLSLDDPVSLSLVEGEAFSYNVSVNVTDDEGDNITFYYENVSAEFCSLDSTNFNSTSGIISFTPTDCDVGYHNVTIIANDGKLNSSKEFNFTVSNVADAPTFPVGYFQADNGNGTVQTIVDGYNLLANESSDMVFNLSIEDFDFLIPDYQTENYGFYNESLTIDVTFTNSTDDVVSDLFNFSFVEFWWDGSRAKYTATFTPLGAQVDNYTVFVNISDANGNYTNRTFYLNISEVLSAPNLTTVSNQSLTIHDSLSFTVSASDEEDDRNGLNLSYDVFNLTVGAPNFSIGNETGLVNFDMGSNSSYAGAWKYNITVTDSDGQVDWQEIYVYVYGNATLVSPSEGSVFNLSESIEGTLNFSVNHSVGDNLTYEFWIDSISCVYNDSSNCSFGNLTFYNVSTSTGDGGVYGWMFTPNYTDETYGNLKNLTVSVSPNATSLNATQRASVATNFSFKLNVSHTNAPIRLTGVGIGRSQADWNSNIEIDLSNYFIDEDVDDEYYSQNITVNVSGDSRVASLSTGWDLILSNIPKTAFTTYLVISVNDSVNESSIENVEIEFTSPTVTAVPSSGGSSTKLKYYSLKIIAPQDVIISEKGFIDVPFSIQNNGQIDLRGISLDSFVRFNDMFSDDVTISLGDNYIEELKFGQSENFTMRIVANTQRAGRYKATIIANVTSPKFSDFGDFYIEIEKANESEAEQILIFTEKFIADNPECLELSETLNLAKDAFSRGDNFEAIRLAQEVTEACEDAIVVNEQIRYQIEGFVEDNFYYISFATLVVFFVGFLFYVYKRVRFNKSGVDEYV